MTSNIVKFVYKNQICEIENPDPNETILNYVRTKLKKQAPKKVVQKEVVGLARLY